MNLGHMMGLGDDSVFRMEIKKNIWEFLRDKWGWYRLTDQERKGWIPPYWYRMETDAEFRERIKRELGEVMLARD